MIYDVLVLGAGPAGLAAAVSAKGRNRSVLVIGNAWEQNPLTKAELVDNYLGIIKVTGRQLMEQLVAHAKEWNVELLEGRVNSALEFQGFSLTVGQDVYQGRSLVLATGVNRAKPYENEEAFLGKGVSYCATCDGFFYKNKAVVVLGLAEEAVGDVNFLQGLGCSVTFIAPKQPQGLHEDISFQKMARFAICGEERVTAVTLDGKTIPCEGVFLLRPSIAPTSLFPNISTSEGYIAVNRRMETNISGLYAVGDCTGLPLQVAKAVGEGHIAGISVSEWLDQQEKLSGNK